jgi:hypothetical protein
MAGGQDGAEAVTRAVVSKCKRSGAQGEEVPPIDVAAHGSILSRAVVSGKLEGRHQVPYAWRVYGAFSSG